MTGLEIYMARALLLLAVCVGIQIEDFTSFANTGSVNPQWLGKWKVTAAGIFTEHGAPLGAIEGDFRIVKNKNGYTVSYLHDPNPKPKVKTFWPVKVGPCGFVVEKAWNALFKIKVVQGTMTLYAMKGKSFWGSTQAKQDTQDETALEYLNETYPTATLTTERSMMTFLKIKTLDAQSKKMLSDLCAKESLWTVLAQLQKVK